MTYRLTQFILFFTAAIGAACFAVPAVAFSASFAPGELVKAADDPKIYYIAGDGKRYHIPNEGTFLSWFSDFSGVRAVKSRFELAAGASAGKGSVTARPGATLLKFSSSPRVYAVMPGGELRWLTDEAAAFKWYGLSWKSRIKEVPDADSSMYSFGAQLSQNSDFSRGAAVRSARSIDDELKRRGFVISAVQKNTNEARGIGLVSLHENLRGSMDPSFKNNVFAYRLSAEPGEDSIQFSPRAYSKTASISVDGVPVTSGAKATFAVPYGETVFTVHSSDSTGAPVSYTVRVVRRRPSGNGFLSSISENVAGSLSPIFQPDKFEYSLSAGHTEDAITISARAQDEHAQVFINGKKATSARLPLSLGENEAIILVRSEAGSERLYKVKINRERFPSLGADTLASLSENLKANFSRPFEPDFSVYHLRAEYGETQITLTARPKDKKAAVYINDAKGASRKVYLYEGENEIRVRVELPTGFHSTYTVIVNRASE